MVGISDLLISRPPSYKEKPQEDRVIGVEPVPELIEALGLKSNEICRLNQVSLWFDRCPISLVQDLE